jgi:hypothetical protein
MGSLLQAFMCGLHGVYPARWVKVASVTATSRIVRTAIGRRRQLFSPTPDRNGRTSNAPITIPGPMSSAGVSIDGGRNESTAYNHKKK